MFATRQVFGSQTRGKATCADLAKVSCSSRSLLLIGPRVDMRDAWHVYDLQVQIRHLVSSSPVTYPRVRVAP